MPIASGACEDLSSRSGDGLIVAKIGRKPGIPALRVTGKGLGCIRSMIVSVCSAFWLFLREIVLIGAKSGGKATVCTVTRVASGLLSHCSLSLDRLNRKVHYSLPPRPLRGSPSAVQVTIRDQQLNTALR